MCSVHENLNSLLLCPITNAFLFAFTPFLAFKIEIFVIVLYSLNSLRPGISHGTMTSFTHLKL